VRNDARKSRGEVDTRVGFGPQYAFHFGRSFKSSVAQRGLITSFRFSFLNDTSFL
jgi:hypothetical protein